MYQNPVTELIKSAYNVFNSSFSPTHISKETGISYTTISELKHEKRSIENVSLSNLKKIYLFAKKYQLDEAYLLQEKSKGTYRFVTVDLPLNKILVANEEMDLLSYGFYKANKGRTNKLGFTEVIPSQNLFITTDNKFYDPKEFGLGFQCGYGGTGPNNFASFLKKYSKIPEEQIKETIFNNKVIEYDFLRDSIKGMPTTIEGKPFSFYKNKERFIIVLNGHNQVITDTTEQEFHELINNLNFLLNRLLKPFNFSNILKKIHHVPNTQIASQSPFVLSDSYYYNEPFYPTILEFEEFEIWLPYLYPVKRNAFKSPFLSEILKYFGIDSSKPKRYSNSLDIQTINTI